jgi:cation diffusion facilitator CzcD-associated flavoprotein CzcO
MASHRRQLAETLPLTGVAQLDPSEPFTLHGISADLADVYPEDMLGNWFEFYTDAMEINCWTDTEFVAGLWNETGKCWSARLKRSDGTERVVRPRHLVFANGVSSYPMIPDLPGLEEFKGEVIHSEGFDSGVAWKGKNAFILGTGSSANDIALDLYSHGVKTMLIQRGSTTVVSIDPSARLNEAIWTRGDRSKTVI